MKQQQFFEHVLRQLERLEIPYMVAGSIGAILHSEPRLTNDMDVVIEPTPKCAAELAAAFPSREFYLTPPDAIQREIERHGMFNLLHIGSGSKVDFIVRKDTPHALEEFSRRRREPFSESFECHSATPEDIVLVKLAYFRDGGSEKHLRDIRSMLTICGDSLDREYLDQWVRRLELEPEWVRAREFDRD